MMKNTALVSRVVLAVVLSLILLFYLSDQWHYERPASFLYIVLAQVLALNQLLQLFNQDSPNRGVSVSQVVILEVFVVCESILGIKNGFVPIE